MRRLPESQDSAGKHRHPREARGNELSAEIAQIGAEIDDPVVKLRYLRGALDASEAYEPRVRWVPFAPVRRALYRWRGLESLQPILDDDRGRTFIQAETHAARRRARLLLGGVFAGGLLLMPALLAAVALSIDISRQNRLPQKVESIAPAGDIVRSPAQDVAPQAGTLAEPMPAGSLDIAPIEIWLADRGTDWELYSNGLRIETRYEVAGEPRRYLVHDRQKGLQPTLHTDPAGILFHTSESDLWPLESDYGAQLRASSSALLRYVQRTKAYNYLIDRFGRVYRVVDDGSRATHAGHAIWAHDDDIYLDLNGAFLGVSFESRWEGGRTLPITQAQLAAGRSLTDYLRHRFAIAPQMCVTHGLASVSPQRHLIGFHLDWARGFPFAAFGLPDLYAHPPPSVELFGFGYDRKFLNAVGEVWPGLTAAERNLAADARGRNVSVDTVRQERQAVYDRWRVQGKEALLRSAGR